MSDPSKKRARAEAAAPPAETPPSATSYPYWASVNSRGVLTAGAEFPAAGVPPEVRAERYATEAIRGCTCRPLPTANG